MGFKVRLHFPFLIQEKIALQFHHAVLGQKINGQWQVISTVSTDEEGLIFCLHLKAESEINIARPISHQERERGRERGGERVGMSENKKKNGKEMLE